MTLPTDFQNRMKELLPSNEYKDFEKSLVESESTTSIRLNRQKINMFLDNSKLKTEGDAVGWCNDGLYLKERPQFTLDPLLHSGVYYVQEASSMFISHIIHSIVQDNRPLRCLDLCAAPGGKSTAAISSLPEGSEMVSNEIDRRRARILAENITKWGNPNITVTSNTPKEFKGLKHVFDIIITDVPCSGEGMFRKDEGAVSDWSLQKVNSCVALQHEILDDIWDCLKPGGLLIYSTCTFNIEEDELMVEYICNELGATALDIPIKSEWNIHKPLAGNNPCYRFMPHYTKGEGLFMAALRKDEGELFKAKSKSGKHSTSQKGSSAKPTKDISSWVNIPVILKQSAEGIISAIPTAHKDLHDLIVNNGLYVLQSGIELGTIKGKDIIPSHNLAMSTVLSDKIFPKYEITKESALDYLRRLAFVLPNDAPTGFIILSYNNVPLGFVKNLGNRCNNLYPQEWRIRNL